MFSYIASLTVPTKEGTDLSFTYSFINETEYNAFCKEAVKYCSSVIGRKILILKDAAEGIEVLSLIWKDNN